MPKVETAACPITNSCPVCNAVAIRDEKLIDLMQTARIALTAADGFNNWQLRDARVKAALEEMLRLMGSRW